MLLSDSQLKVLINIICVFLTVCQVMHAGLNVIISNIFI